jgi:hypothetical protein
MSPTYLSARIPKLSTAIVMLAILLAPDGLAQEPQAVASAIEVGKSAREIFRDRCIACHGETVQEGNLRLDRSEGLMAGGDSGNAIAVGRSHDSLLIEEFFPLPASPTSDLSATSERSLAGKTLLPTPGKNHEPIPIYKKMNQNIVKLFGIAVVAILLCMMPGLTTDRNNFNYRIPPSWSPENDQHYSFRAFMTDISLWIMLTDLQPHQQCAAIIMRFGGSAREMARMITPQEMMNGAS